VVERFKQKRKAFSNFMISAATWQTERRIIPAATGKKIVGKAELSSPSAFMPL